MATRLAEPCAVRDGGREAKNSPGDRPGVPVRDVLGTARERLCAALDEVLDAARDGRGREVVGPLLDGAVATIKIYFTREEQALERAGCPRFAAHRREHEELVRLVIQLRYRFEATGGSGVGVEPLGALRARVLAHLEHADHQDLAARAMS